MRRTRKGGLFWGYDLRQTGFSRFRCLDLGSLVASEIHAECDSRAGSFTATSRAQEVLLMTIVEGPFVPVILAASGLLEGEMLWYGGLNDPSLNAHDQPLYIVCRWSLGRTSDWSSHTMILRWLSDDAH